MIRVGDWVAALESLYDPAWAADWDAVGLVTGDPDAEAGEALFAIDPVAATVDEAERRGVRLLVTHHPLLLRGVHGVPVTDYKGRLVDRLVRAGIALYVAHTNADVANPGVSDALAAVLGLRDTTPLAPDPPDDGAKLVTYVPADAAGERTSVAERRVELVVPARRVADAVRALRAAHPHEEPAYEIVPTLIAHTRGAGRVGVLPSPTPLVEFATRLRTVLPESANRIRVAGDAGAVIRTVAVCGGAGDDLIDAARHAGADVYVTADLRHHPVSEARERGLALIDAGHWATEWPWLADAAQRVAHRLGGVPAHVSTLVTDPWSLHA